MRSSCTRWSPSGCSRRGLRLRARVTWGRRSTPGTSSTRTRARSAGCRVYPRPPSKSLPDMSDHPDKLYEANYCILAQDRADLNPRKLNAGLQFRSRLRHAHRDRCSHARSVCGNGLWNSRFCRTVQTLRGGNRKRRFRAIGGNSGGMLENTCLHVPIRGDSKIGV